MGVLYAVYVSISDNCNSFAFENTALDKEYEIDCNSNKMSAPRKNKTSYKVWKFIFKLFAWYSLVMLVVILLSYMGARSGEIFFLPMIFYIIVVLPAGIISFVALFIMRENDRERERMGSD